MAKQIKGTVTAISEELIKICMQNFERAKNFGIKEINWLPFKQAWFKAYDLGFRHGASLKLNLNGEVLKISEEITRDSGFKLKIIKLKAFGSRKAIPVQFHQKFYYLLDDVRVGDEVNVAAELNQYGETDSCNVVAVGLRVLV